MPDFFDHLISRLKKLPPEPKVVWAEMPEPLKAMPQPVGTPPLADSEAGTQPGPAPEAQAPPVPRSRRSRPKDPK